MDLSVCQYRTVYESKSFAEIETIFLEGDSDERAGLLVYGFDYWHHKPRYLLSAVEGLPTDERLEVAGAMLDLEPGGGSRAIAEQLIERER